VKRRVFIALVGGAAVSWPLGARAQRPTVPVIGFMNSGSPETMSHRSTAFREGLSATGYIADQNVKIEFRWAEGHYDRLPAMAADLVRRQVTVIAATSTPAALAAKDNELEQAELAREAIADLNPLLAEFNARQMSPDDYTLLAIGSNKRSAGAVNALSTRDPHDLMKESRTVGHDGRATLLPFEVVTFARQADQPTRAPNQADRTPCYHRFKSKNRSARNPDSGPVRQPPKQRRAATVMEGANAIINPARSSGPCAGHGACGGVGSGAIARGRRHPGRGRPAPPRSGSAARRATSSASTIARCRPTCAAPSRGRSNATTGRAKSAERRPRAKLVRAARRRAAPAIRS
jgi:hypothetical protein